MPELTPNEQSGSPRRRTLTPEQRRLLNTPRTIPPAVSAKEPREMPDEAPPLAPPEEQSATVFEEQQQQPASTPVKEEASRTSGRIDLAAQTKASQAVEMRHALTLLSGFVILAFVFFAGRKFDAIRYHLMTRLSPPKLDQGAKSFPGLSAEELIESALSAERRGDWNDAADRFLAAKRLNHAIPGILFRVGKSAFDRNELVNADYAFDQAIHFGESLPTANYYRGLIAVRRHDLAAATRFFEAAANADPFMADFYYHWGETLRLDHHPREAIRRYEQAVERTSSLMDATLCQFKIRLARLEAVEGDRVGQDLANMRKSGPLPVDWLMTDAALQLQTGNISEASQLIREAQGKGPSGLFLTCSGDTIFLQAATVHPEIAAALNPSPAPSVPPESSR